MNLHEFLRKISKAELHVHLTGTVFPKTLQKLSRKHAVKLPSHDRIEDLYDRSEFKSILPMLKIAVSVMSDIEMKLPYKISGLCLITKLSQC